MESAMIGDVGGLRVRLQEQMEEHLDRWVELDAVVRQIEGCQRHSIMASNLLQWSARNVYSLYVEWEAVQEGMLSYKELYCTRYEQ